MSNLIRLQNEWLFARWARVRQTRFDPYANRCFQPLISKSQLRQDDPCFQTLVSKRRFATR